MPVCKSRVWGALGLSAVAVGAASAFSLYVVHTPAASTPVPNSAPPTAAAAGAPGPPAAEASGVIRTARTDPRADAAFVATLPTQFQNTHVDGAITLDADGDLRPSRALRDLFDYFLSGIGRYKGHDQQAAARQNLARYSVMQDISAQARSRLLRLFDQYVRLGNRLANESAAFADTDLSTRLAIVSDMRRAELGPAVAEAFYGHDEADTAGAIAEYAAASPRSGGRQDPTLAAAARIDAARDNGASDSDIADMRRQAFGAEAQERLAALDAQRQAWHKRYATYANERDAVLASAMSAGDHQQALTALRARFFENDAQRRRAAALDRIAAPTP